MDEPIYTNKQWRVITIIAGILGAVFAIVGFIVGTETGGVGLMSGGFVMYVGIAIMVSSTILYYKTPKSNDDD